jgi:adenylate cyclase
MSEARELDLALMMADLCGYTALTETHGALQASETVLRFVRLVEASLEPGVRIVDSIGDSVFCAGEDTLAVVRTAQRLREAVSREPGFPRVSTGIHRGPIVEREARLFGAPINLTARLTSHAAGEQILCTGPIAGAIAAAEGVKCRPLGEQHFRNVAHPVALFELVPADESRAASAIDPVCRMQVEVDHAAATVEHGGRSYWFCSAHCAHAFSEAPGLYS